MASEAPFPEDHFREAAEAAVSWSDLLRKLGYEVKGHNIRTVQRWARNWSVSTQHFDANAARGAATRARARPLEEVMTANSAYPRASLRRRLLAAGIKQPVCEKCGTSDRWHGERMSMVLDHINGIANDHRLENLRMLCPNCAATLDTHCGRNVPRERVCPRCDEVFVPKNGKQRYCSLECWGSVASERFTGVPHVDTRKVERPPYAQLLAEIEASSFSAVGRKYGVSDNAVRKWLRWYVREQQRHDTRPGDGSSDPLAA